MILHIKDKSFLKKVMPYLVCFSAAIFFAYELIQMHMMNAIAPMLMKDLNLNAMSFGNLCATYLLADVIFLLPAGIILDRFSTRKVILTALGICILGTTGFAFAHGIYVASICHFFSGIGNAFCFLSTMMLISKWFPLQRQAFIVGLVITIGMLGGVIAQGPFSLIAEMLTWRNALMVDAMLGVIIYMIVYIFVYDSPIKITNNTKSSIPIVPFWNGVRQSIFNIQNIFCGMYTSFMNLPLMVIGAVWGSLFLTQGHNISLVNASLIISMICIGTIIGSPIYGYFSDNTNSRKPYMISGAILSIGVMLLILFTKHPTEPILMILFFLLGLFSSSQILGYPLITESNPKELTGTSMGVAAVIIMGVPMLVQMLSGVMLDFCWDGTMKNGSPLYSLNNYLISFSIFPVGMVIAIFSAFFIKEKRQPIHLKNTRSTNFNFLR